MDGLIEVLLGHPGGPIWAHKDEGVWSILKGLVEPGEDLLAAAIREFTEESGTLLEGPFVSIGSVVLKSGKVVHGWACEAELDASALFSNTCTIVWPKVHGKRIEIPEIDRFCWFSLEEAWRKINPAQVEFLERLQN